MPAKKQASAKTRGTKSDPKAFAKTRARLDQKREERRLKMMWVHYWLLCPKCGGDMFVQTVQNIRFEVCRSCHGIAIDGDRARVDTIQP